MATLGRKTDFVNNYPLLLVWSKRVATNSNFPQDLALSNMVGNTNFLSISVHVSEIVTFLTKREVLCDFYTKMLQNNRKV